MSKCGENLKWSFIDRDCTLKVSGTGVMTDYFIDDGDPKGIRPWEGLIDKIKTIIIDDSVTSIGNQAFRNCSSLEMVIISSTVERIGDSAFMNCGLLKTVIFKHCCLDDVFVEIETAAFYNCSSLSSIAMPSQGNIGDVSFKNCKSILAIRVPVGTEHISEGAFMNCENLLAVDIPETVKEIDEDAFWGCNNLTRVKLHNSVERIGVFYLK